MKTFLSLILLLTSLSSFAGVLENAVTGETLEFKRHPRMADVVLIESNSALLQSVEVPLNSLNINMKKIKVFPITSILVEDPNGGEGWAPFIPFTAVVDIAILPFNAAGNLIKKGSTKKAVQSLARAIATNETVEVPPKQFEYICRKLRRNLRSWFYY